MTSSLRLTVVDDKFFTRSQSGTIWGRVYFEIGDHFFPDNGWTDIVVAFSSAWLEALIRIGTESASRERVWFMDGPFVIDISAEGGHGLLGLSFLYKEAVRESTGARLRDLLQNAIAASG